MQIKEILKLEDLNLKDALGDESIFVLTARYQQKVHKPEEDATMELRCSCKPICYMTAKCLKELFDNPDKHVLVRIEV